MTTLLKDKTIEEAKKIFEKFQSLITKDVSKQIDAENYGKMAVFAGVREFPARVKCASLAWHTMKSAIDKNNKTVTTE